jgi:hypothetical protein
MKIADAYIRQLFKEIPAVLRVASPHLLKFVAGAEHYFSRHLAEVRH